MKKDPSPKEPAEESAAKESVTTTPSPPRETSPAGIKKETLLAVVLTILLLITIVQAVQLSVLSVRLAGGPAAAQAAPVATASGNSNPALSQANLPSMVGGC